MGFSLENRVFLQRNGKLLLFNDYGMYSGDNTNIDDYVDRGELRYITVEAIDGEIKQINCYFANTTDQHLTQHGEWIYIEEAGNLPATELMHAVLDNYHQEARYDSKVRLLTKTTDGVTTSVIAE